ncbi:carbohydrate-binding family 9-like protein [Pontibacter virosus]|uniref:Cellulose/xylan binding protein with CBM9 domain n=1 Tax=Pontibacter virosus TaxID=1765052 RepID=A0A2U1B5C8_9BACT|nr:carbohydrate-binding family 9-like protein [Pontibacter virosus]PVY43727.1 cellulose/xylan binding protein with CBM9 domain [Pontibacter virosus]
MRHLELPLLPHVKKDSPFLLIDSELDKLPTQLISNAPWATTQEKPEVEFVMAHSGDCLFLKYYVTEQHVLARYRQPNDPVYKDSCVELFISFQNDPAYYNIEFNCLGTCRIGFGPERHNRKLLPPATIAKIRSSGTLRAGNSASHKKAWQLTLVIPISIFSEHQLASLESEEHARVNFCKCGDELPEPHFLTWNMIQAPEPNFHLPEFFGTVKFLSSRPQPAEHASVGHSR